MPVTNLRDYLSDTGEIPDDLPIAKHKMLTRLGQIVAMVSGSLPQGDAKEIALNMRCTRRPGNNACTGYLFGEYVPDDPLSVSWSCSRCRGSGIICGWEDTIWDQRTSLQAILLRGWKRQPLTLNILIPVSSLREISVYRPDDIYDFARLMLELSELNTRRFPEKGTRSLTIYWLIQDFASFIDRFNPDINFVGKAVATADLPLTAIVVPDNHR